MAFVMLMESCPSVVQLRLLLRDRPIAGSILVVDLRLKCRESKAHALRQVKRHRCPEKSLRRKKRVVRWRH